MEEGSVSSSGNNLCYIGVYVGSGAGRNEYAGFIVPLQTVMTFVIGETKEIKGYIKEWDAGEGEKQANIHKDYNPSDFSFFLYDEIEKKKYPLLGGTTIEKPALTILVNEEIDEKSSITIPLHFDKFDDKSSSVGTIPATLDKSVIKPALRADGKQRLYYRGGKKTRRKRGGRRKKRKTSRKQRGGDPRCPICHTIFVGSEAATELTEHCNTYHKKYLNACFNPSKNKIKLEEAKKAWKKDDNNIDWKDTFEGEDYGGGFKKTHRKKRKTKRRKRTRRQRGGRLKKTRRRRKIKSRKNKNTVHFEYISGDMLGVSPANAFM